MKKTELEIYLGRHVQILLQSGIFYHGHIKELNEQSLLLIDRFEEEVTIAYTHILTVRPYQNKTEQRRLQ